MNYLIEDPYNKSGFVTFGELCSWSTRLYFYYIDSVDFEWFTVAYKVEAR